MGYQVTPIPIKEQSFKRQREISSRLIDGILGKGHVYLEITVQRNEPNEACESGRDCEPIPESWCLS